MSYRNTWEQVAPNYNAEIFDVFKADKKKLLKQTVQSFANRKHSVIDFGCGNGKAFDYLAPNFKHVLAVDFSAELVSAARKTKYRNIDFQTHDLTKPLKAMADFGFCCNVMIAPDAAKNQEILRNIHQSIKPSGHVVFVVPSLESFLFSAWAMAAQYRDEGVAPKDADPSDFAGLSVRPYELAEGIVKINGQRTKHYTHGELIYLFRNAGFKGILIEKLEYAWDTEFQAPARWLKEPRPWDWMIVAKS